MKHNLLIYLVIITVCFTACEEVVDPYEGGSGIYFDNNGLNSDTIKIAWGLDKSEVKERIVKLRVNLFGNVVDYDRSFTIRVLSEEQDTIGAKVGVDYKMIATDYKLAANEEFTIIELPIMRTEVLTKHARRFKVMLNETPELRFLYSRETRTDSGEIRKLDVQRVIYMNEDFPRPWWWTDYGENIFGKWSAKKSILICDELDIDRRIWIGNLVDDFTVGYLKFAGKYMHRWLQENPTQDEDGSLMEMGSASKL